MYSFTFERYASTFIKKKKKRKSIILWIIMPQKVCYSKNWIIGGNINNPISEVKLKDILYKQYDKFS